MGIDAIGSTTQSYQPTPIDSSSAAKTGADTVTVDAIKPVANNESMVKSENGNQPSDEEVKSAIKEANKRAIFGHASAQFSYHEATKRISVKIVDNDTKEIIREIPPEKTLDMISKMWELAGLVVDEKR
ncbi:MAG: flagellar protein FlaG [Lachnospiraceae bacterium]|nr:flagellar protein FlaG [Lachnospiraceae bacterium]MBR3580100.1 flagellar protein FlaG [Lachnospiraceae bacterium]